MKEGCRPAPRRVALPKPLLDYSNHGGLKSGIKRVWGARLENEAWDLGLPSVLCTAKDALLHAVQNCLITDIFSFLGALDRSGGSFEI